MNIKMYYNDDDGQLKLGLSLNDQRCPGLSIHSTYCVHTTQCPLERMVGLKFTF